MGTRKLTIFAAHTDSIWENKMTMRGSVPSHSGGYDVRGLEKSTLTFQRYIILDAKNPHKTQKYRLTYGKD